MSAYFALLIVLLGCIIQSQAAADNREQLSSFYGEKWAWNPRPPYYYYHPWRPVVPRPRPQIPPKALQCIRDLTIEGNCTKAVVHSIFTGKLDLSHECCEAVKNMTDDCVAPLFARFNTPTYFPFLKKYCSQKGAQPPTTSPIVGQPPSEQPQPPSESPPVVGEPLPPSEQPQPPVVGEPLPPSEQPPIVGDPQPPSEQPQPPSEQPPIVGEPLPPSEQPQPPSEQPPVVGEPLPPSEQPPIVGEPLPPSEQPQPPSESPPVVGEPQPPSEAPSPSFEGWF
ncbi:hypothetical protein M5689_011548 [Euphorbia peplus]|nr:hypothetical protein M5689_011548 [Euphorbia peplus]